MLEWIIRNKEWLFSGVGVAVGVAVIGLFVRWLAKTIRSREPATPPFDQATFRARPLPREINDQIESVPVVHQENRAQEFVGLKVQWKTTLQSARPVDNKTIHLMLLDRGSHPWVVCDVPKDLYPDLLLARRGTAVWVAGKIARWDQHDFIIEEPQLRFLLPED